MLQLLLQLQSHFKVMGNACCVALRNKMVLLPNSSSASVILLLGKPLSVGLSDGISRNDVSDIKCDFLSSQGSPLESFRTQTMQKNYSMDTVFEQKEKDSIESAAPSYPSPAQLSLSLASQPSSFPTSQLPSQIYYHPASSSTLNPTQQVSDGKICGMSSLSRSSATEEEEKGTPLEEIRYAPRKNKNEKNIERRERGGHQLRHNQYLRITQYGLLLTIKFCF
ncbi:hypothetical protein Bca52824_093050 [Brassica carinata]|uniref:Uncharacterized protein n=1 Tax=Brassica carinata TaxID=52824 RepID=A0A8X7TK95_BRACI|nr:hypothetical protein Bca52824_093050 [Brassica carinata]